MSERFEGAVHEADDMTFDRVVLGRDGGLVEFFAPWCGNCRRFAPIWERLAGEYAGQVPFLKVNAEENPELVRRYEVSSTPTLVLFRNGEPVARMVGAQPEEAVRELLGPARTTAAPVAGSPSGWAPADACTLPTEARPGVRRLVRHRAARSPAARFRCGWPRTRGWKRPRGLWSSGRPPAAPSSTSG